jgi:hypothetical protein
MSVGVTSNNTTIKIVGKCSAGYTVLANQYVIATFAYVDNAPIYFNGCFQIFYGPGDTVASSQTTASGYQNTFVTGVIFSNSP